MNPGIARPFPERPPEPLQARLFRSLYRLSGRRGFLDRLLSERLKYRRYFTSVPPQVTLPDYDAIPVSVRQTPEGLWASPLIDVVVVVKAAVGFQAKRILEVGSYRGYTARMIAENTPDDTRIWTLDVDPRHGAAYADSPVRTKIERLVGRATLELAGAGAPYDLIFIDADHDFQSAAEHTLLAWQLLAPGGVVLWHDYRHDTYFQGGCQVPEAIEAARGGRDVVAIEGTLLAMHCSRPGWESGAVAARYRANPDPIWGGGADG